MTGRREGLTDVTEDTDSSSHLDRPPRSRLLLGLTVAPAVALFGAAFAAAATEVGIPPVVVIAMSAATFAGAAQLATVSVLAQGGGVLAAVISGLLINARYVAMSASVARHFTGAPWRRFIVAQLLVDESWALAQKRDGFDVRVMIAVGLLLWVAWVGGTAVGLVTQLVTDPAVLGLDAAIATIFIGLLLPLLNGGRSRPVAIAGAFIALGTLTWLPPGVPIVLASAAALIALLK